jgi:hypothetical protein
MPKKTENYLPEPEETHYEDVLSGLHPFEGGIDWDYKHNENPKPKTKKQSPFSKTKII